MNMLTFLMLMVVRSNLQKWGILKHKKSYKNPFTPISTRDKIRSFLGILLIFAVIQLILLVSGAA